MLSPIVGNSAQNKKQAQQELEALQKAIQSIQNELQSNRKQQTSTEKQIANIEKELSQATRQLKTTQQHISQQKSELSVLKKQQLEKEKLISLQKNKLAGQLKSAYVSGQQEYIKLLLNQEDPAKISRVLQYYRYLNQARINDIQLLQTTITQLADIEQQVQTKLLSLQQLEHTQKQQQSTQLALKKEQRTVLGRLQQEYKDSNNRLAKLKRDEQELEKIIQSLEETLKNFAPKQELNGLANHKKQLHWPVQGSILHRFGSNKFEDKLKWNGIVINADSGATVQAIHNGQIVFADWLRGFGLLTIIDHGKGYLSLYGQSQSLLKSPGDWVEAGEPIATAGQSGGANQTGLYFEIRYQGKPKNPLAWIK